MKTSFVHKPTPRFIAQTITGYSCSLSLSLSLSLYIYIYIYIERERTHIIRCWFVQCWYWSNLGYRMLCEKYSLDWSRVRKVTQFEGENKQHRCQILHLEEDTVTCNGGFTSRKRISTLQQLVLFCTCSNSVVFDRRVIST